jgi:uncharacterized membrane protein (DUF485 family)
MHVSEAHENRDQNASRRPVRRLAIMLGVLAFGLYVGFIALTVFQARH